MEVEIFENQNENGDINMKDTTFFQPSIENLISHPLKIIQQVYEKLYQSGKSLDGPCGIPELFESTIKANWNLIPSLNNTPIDHIPSGSLVRFRGMIQDMFDPEYFVGYFLIKDPITKQLKIVSKKFSEMTFDSMSNDTESSSIKIMERVSMYCIPIPGLTRWCEETPITPSYMSHSEGQKRKREEDEYEEFNFEIPPLKQKMTEKISNPVPSKINVDLNFPLPRMQGRSCLVKVYDNYEKTFKLNEIFEFLGILSIVPQNTFHGDHEEKEDMDADPFQNEFLYQTPTSVVPHLHCITFRRLTNLELFTSIQEIPRVVDSLRSRVIDIRGHLIQYISSVLGEDKLASEYLLLNFLSKIFRRTENLSLGKLSINIFGIPENSNSFIKAFDMLMGSLVPKYFLLPLSLNNLNELRFVPHKDYITNRLISGLLQLSEGTFLILDETALETGQLNPKGTQNIQNLAYLLVWQKVQYDFEYHKVEFEVDLPCIILSVGKSLLPSDCLIPLRPSVPLSTISTPQIPTPFDPMDFLQICRTYLAYLRNLNYSVAAAISQELQTDFVEKRKQDPNIRQDAFHLWLTLARLHSLSFGEDALSLATWKHMLQLETERNSRMNQTENQTNQ